MYHNLLAATRYMAYQPETEQPCLSTELQASLVRYLLAEKRFDDAIKLAKLSSYSEESADNTPMLLAVLAEEGLSDLQRAEVMWEHGDVLRLTSGDAAWRESFEAAADLYNKAGHATGALDIRIDLIKHWRDDSTSVAEDTAELWRIMETMEAVGNWASVNRCLSVIITINTAGFRVPPESLQAKVEEEWIRVADVCANKAARVSGSVEKILEWQSRKSRTAKGLDFLEHFYEKIKDSDATAVICMTLSTLCTTYQSIGENDKAIECLARRPEVLPRSLMLILGADPFEAALNAATEAPDAELELKALRDELQRVQAIIRRTPTALERATEVERLSNICHVYTTQHTFRGLEQLESLVACLESVIEEECKKLDDWQATIWRARALQTRAILPQLGARTATTMDELQIFIRESGQYYQRALDLYNASGHSQDWRAASAKTYVANNRKLLWQLNQRPAKSDDFMVAATLYAEAVGSGPLDQQQATCLALLRHWVEGRDANVEMDVEMDGNVESDPAVSSQPRSAYEMAVKWANEADRLASIQRNDLSALPRERAVLAKQMLSSKRDPKTDFHIIALLLHDSAGDDLGAWNWLQKTKARSISDMLGLGINIPTALRHIIEFDANLTSSCEAEQTLSRELSTAPEDRQLLLRMKLESHRADMKQNPTLKQLLDYREGQPTSLERLQSISASNSNNTRPPTRRIFYIDWLVHADQCFAFIASSTGVESFATGVTVPEIAAWKTEYLSSSDGSPHPLDSPEIEPLQKLSKLIQEILKRTEPKDILVFCPSGILHGVPLHAATLADDSRTTLLERNPVVYTASMTSFEQCVAKEAERAHHRSGEISRSYLAVYERTETESLSEKQTAQRDEIYAVVQTVATRGRRQPSAAGASETPTTTTTTTTTTSYFGSEASRERLVASLSEADYLYFFGHCVSSTANMLLQGLVLDGSNNTGNTGNDDDHLNADPDADPDAGDRQVFTASDMFAVDVKTSCLTLIACGSAQEDHGRGDEPLGIVSALLCAGATSVIGTMWKVQVGTARVFTEALDRSLDLHHGGGDGGGGRIDLAVAVQSAALRLKRRREGNTHHPYHWAAFVLHGSWFMSKQAPPV